MSLWQARSYSRGRVILSLINRKSTIDESKVNAVLENANKTQTLEILNHFDKNVPHWFISLVSPE
jgi:hypothetical protein